MNPRRKDSWMNTWAMSISVLVLLVGFNHNANINAAVYVYGAKKDRLPLKMPPSEAESQAALVKIMDRDIFPDFRAMADVATARFLASVVNSSSNKRLTKESRPKLDNEKKLVLIGPWICELHTGVFYTSVTYENAVYIIEGRFSQTQDQKWIATFFAISRGDKH